MAQKKTRRCCVELNFICISLFLVLAPHRRENSVYSHVHVHYPTLYKLRPHTALIKESGVVSSNNELTFAAELSEAAFNSFINNNHLSPAPSHPPRP